MPRKPAKRTTAPAAVSNGKAGGTPAANGVGPKRRERVIDAAIEIIATQGIHNLSLGKIERKVQMARGHLTYYFPTKEAILLAVFDRMLQRMIAEGMKADGPKPGTGQAWDCARTAFARMMEPMPADFLPFVSLVHTFHAQIGYRDDFRAKIAEANAGWRGTIAADYAGSVPHPPVPPAILASIVMALHQGLTGQLTVDPEAFDRGEMLKALIRLLAPMFGATDQGNRP